MKCLICKNGETQKGYATVTMERHGSVVVIKEVPADICNNCGEYYLDEKTAKEVLQYAENAINKGTEIEVIKHGKVA